MIMYCVKAVVLAVGSFTLSGVRLTVCGEAAPGSLGWPGGLRCISEPGRATLTSIHSLRAGYSDLIAPIA